MLDCDPGLQIQQIEFQKSLHVSPFNPMDMKYRWCSNQPNKGLSLNLETEHQGEIHMDATLALKRREIDGSSLGETIRRYPWMTAKVAFSIYSQAFRLWLKRTPFYTHPASEINESTMNQMNTRT